MSWFCALKVNRTIFQSSLFSCPNAHNRFLQIGIYVRLSASNKVEQLSLPFISVLLPLFQYPCVHGVVPAFRFYSAIRSLRRIREHAGLLWTACVQAPGFGSVLGERAQLPAIPPGHPPCQAWSERAPTLSRPSELRT